MKKIPSRVLSVVFFTAICTACSVKEDRDACPCRLLLDFSEVDTSVIRSADLLVTAPDGIVFADEVGAEEFAREYERDVPREKLWLNVYEGTEECPVGNEGLVIPYGSPAPPVYLYASEVDARGEWVREHVRMRKEHCVVTIQVNDEGGFPFGIVVNGCIDGYDVSGTPRKGKFRAEAIGNAEGGFSVTVPRQLDRSLELEVLDDEGSSRTFAIGEYLHESGYSWESADLEDITLWMDYSSSRMSISIAGWDKEYMYDVII